jgi:CBS domain-containing protein
VGSQERPETEDARPIPPSIRMYHLGESGTRRPGCDQPTAETAINVKEDSEHPYFWTPSMDRSAVITFSGQLREARENALRDSEAFDGIIHVVERLGSFLDEGIGHLGKYKEKIVNKASNSALAEDIPCQQRGIHVPFSLLYDLVTDARNDALHQGAFARRLTGHAIKLSLVLEDALRRSLDSPVVSDYMVRNPTCAELWQPISFIRHQMLANSFSFLPVKSATEWCLVSDSEIATYLGTDPLERRNRLAHTLDTRQLHLRPAKSCAVDTPLDEALRILEGSPRPLLVCREEGEQQALVGIITPFDFL